MPASYDASWDGARTNGETTRMAVFEFTLIVEGPDLQTDDLIDALHAAGCDDGLVSRSHGVQHVDFDREAASVEEAVFSAIAALETLPGVEAVRIADAGLVSMSGIAARTGRTVESVRLLVEGARGPGGFPLPVTHPRGRNRLWRSSEVERWFAAYEGEQPDFGPDRVLTALNAGLELRRHRAAVEPGRRAELRQLIGL